MNKPTHVKPSFYAYSFQPLKEIALKYGYNLVLHGSLNRDMDLIAIPWQEELGSVCDMIKEFADRLGGEVMSQTEKERKCFPHGRESHVINLNRKRELLKEPDAEGCWAGPDPQWYLDISVTPAI